VKHSIVRTELQSNSVDEREKKNAGEKEKRGGIASAIPQK